MQDITPPTLPKQAPTPLKEQLPLNTNFSFRKQPMWHQCESNIYSTVKMYYKVKIRSFLEFCENCGRDCITTLMKVGSVTILPTCPQLAAHKYS
jgi:hypothetical protein